MASRSSSLDSPFCYYGAFDAEYVNPLLGKVEQKV
jgi:hypothetical protein